MIKITQELIYKDLYNSAYENLLEYEIDKDLASIKAIKYAAKNASNLFASDDLKAIAYRRMLDYKFNGEQYLTLEEIDELLESANKELL